jgi:hypothetical protein
MAMLTITSRAGAPLSTGFPKRVARAGNLNGRTWDRTRDLSRVKRALSR